MASKDTTDGSEQSERPTLREWVKQQADALDVGVERVLFNSRSRDPMWKGTNGDWKKARWFARQYEQAVANRKGDRIHTRGIHYSIVKRAEDVESPSGRTSWAVYSNTKTCYSFLKDASTLARILGTVPMDAIVDEKNDQTVITDYGETNLQPRVDALDNIDTAISTPTLPDAEESAGLMRRNDEDMADALGRRIANDLRWEMQHDRAAQQPYHLEIWSEKTVPDVTHELAEEHGVNAVVEGQGDLSYSVANNLVRRIESAGKPAVILYLSDFDPKGDNMATAMSGKLAWLYEIGELTERVYVEQLAVNEDQIDRFDLARKPIDTSAGVDAGAGEKAYDTLVNDWEQRKGRGAVELQSLWSDEDRYRMLVEEAITRYRDTSLSKRTRKAVKSWQSDTAEALADHIRDTDLLDRVDDLEAWVKEFNEEWSDVQEALADLRELKDDDRYTGWLSEAPDAARGFEPPEFEPPSGEADAPDDPLFDTDRHYMENREEIERHRHGER